MLTASQRFAHSRTHLKLTGAPAFPPLAESDYLLGNREDVMAAALFGLSGPITVNGQDSHAGSTPMAGRRDALVAASRLIRAVQDIALEFKPDGVGTVGEMRLMPNSRNTIPGEIFLTVDIRHPDDQALESMAARLAVELDRLSENPGIEVHCEEIWHNPAVKFDERCIAAVSGAAESLGYSNQRIVSGAGHDACQVCRIVPTSMIFVPCEGGLSHNEEEHAEPVDLEAGCNVLLHAMLELAGKP